MERQNKQRRSTALLKPLMHLCLSRIRVIRAPTYISRVSRNPDTAMFNHCTVQTMPLKYLLGVQSQIDVY
jgi:hypothetical protein